MHIELSIYYFSLEAFVDDLKTCFFLIRQEKASLTVSLVHCQTSDGYRFKRQNDKIAKCHRIDFLRYKLR